MTSNLKFPFLAALTFHAVALAGLGAWQPSIRSAITEITPIAVIELPKEDAGAVKAEVKKEEKAPVKAAKPEAPKPPKPEIKPLRAEAPQPVKEVKAEPVVEPVSEPVAEAVAEPAPKVEAVAALPEAKVDASAGSVPARESVADGPAHASHADHNESARQSADEMTYFYSLALQRIDRFKVYPRWARERGFEGVVGVQFVVGPEGEVSDIKVVRPCHCDILNKAACEAVKKAAPYTPRPRSREGKAIAMEVNVGFRLD